MRRGSEWLLDDSRGFGWLAGIDPAHRPDHDGRILLLARRLRLRHSSAPSCSCASGCSCTAGSDDRRQDKKYPTRSRASAPAEALRKLLELERGQDLVDPGDDGPGAGERDEEQRLVWPGSAHRPDADRHLEEAEDEHVPPVRHVPVRDGADDVEKPSDSTKMPMKTPTVCSPLSGQAIKTSPRRPRALRAEVRPVSTPVERRRHGERGALEDEESSDEGRQAAQGPVDGQDQGAEDDRGDAREQEEPPAPRRFLGIRRPNTVRSLSGFINTFGPPARWVESSSALGFAGVARSPSGGLRGGRPSRGPARWSAG